MRQRSSLGHFSDHLHSHRSRGEVWSGSGCLVIASNLAKLAVETEDRRSAVAPDPIPLTGESTADTRALSRCKAMSGSFQRGRFQVCVFG